MDNNFKILVSFRNAEKYLEKSIQSVLSQTYQNFEILLVNDASTDNSHQVCEKYSKMYPEKIKYTKNESRKWAVFNHQREILNNCEPEDIVVQLDGDDYLIDQYVLTYINEFYKREKCLYMYGQAVYITGRKGNAVPYPSKLDFENKRNLPQYVSHIRTFKAKLFYELKRQDPELKSMKYDDGTWFRMGYDCAQLYSLMEIAGWEKVRYNDKVLYVYNNLNPECDFKVDLSEQEEVHRICISRPPFKYKDFDNEN